MTDLNGDYFDPAIIDPAGNWDENLDIARAHHMITESIRDDEPP
jgi:hypothetical protein